MDKDIGLLVIMVIGFVLAAILTAPLWILLYIIVAAAGQGVT